MRIIFDNIIFWLQKSGGGSVYWTELLKRFSVLNNDNIFFDQKEPTDNIFRKTLQLNPVKQESKFSLKIRRYLPFTEKIKEKHIFHSSYFRFSNSEKAINVTTIHDFTTEKFRKGLAREVNLLQKRIAVSKSKGVICISENTKKDLLHFCPNLDLDKIKIKVIYNGVSNDFYHIDKDFDISQVDPRFQALGNRKYLLYIGHRTSYKNFDFAIEAANKFLDSLKLVIVGEALSEAEKKAVEAKLGDNYLQLSKLGNEGLNYLYNQAFALVYPSSYEGFGIPIVEAMKTKCPVIAFNNSSIPEVAGDYELIYTIEHPDSIIDAINKLQNNAFRERLTEKGFVQSKKFDWDNTAKQYLEFYKELYNEKN